MLSQHAAAFAVGHGAVANVPCCVLHEFCSPLCADGGPTICVHWLPPPIVQEKVSVPEPEPELLLLEQASATNAPNDKAAPRMIHLDDVMPRSLPRSRMSYVAYTR